MGEKFVKKNNWSFCVLGACIYISLYQLEYLRGKYNMKKMLPIFVIGFLVVNGLIGAAQPNDLTRVLSNMTPCKSDNSKLLDDELDQSQTEYYTMQALGWYYQYTFGPHAQEFTPQKDILTRVYIYAGKVGWPEPFHLAIREELEGENLTTLSKSHSSFPSWENPQWIEFDFEDISVIPGKSYYIIFSTQKKSNTFYEIGWAENNPYLNGSPYLTHDFQDWDEYENNDFSFQTYGRNYPLQITAKGGLGKVGARLMSNFGYDLENVQWTISVQGGFLNRINTESDGVIDLLEDSTQISISIDGFIFGLGPIEIAISVELETGEKIKRAAEGFVLFFFVFIS